VRWHISHRADPQVVPIADRHYNRQKIGSPQFAPPGSCRVLKYAPEGIVKAFWITSAPYAEFVKHAWPGAWVCSAFRNETREQSSELIREALAASVAVYGLVPDRGIVTFVDPKKVPGVCVRGERVYGYCFLKAGFRHVGFTKGRLWAWMLDAPDFPEPMYPLGHYHSEPSLF